VETGRAAPDNHAVVDHLNLQCLNLPSGSLHDPLLDGLCEFRRPGPYGLCPRRFSSIS
jgi:hypothetical protein